MDEYTKLLLHFDTDFTDSSTSNHTVSAQGSTAIDSAQSVFGGASAHIPGGTSYISIPDSDDWYFNGDFTIDTRIRFDTVGTMGIISQDQANDAGFDIYYAGGVINFLVDDGGATVAWSWTPTADTWYHFEVARNGNNWYLFIDGVQTGGTQTSAKAFTNRAAPLLIGATWYDGALNIPFNGWFDEFRISKGIARHTANFTPPTEAYGAGSGRTAVTSRDATGARTASGTRTAVTSRTSV